MGSGNYVSHPETGVLQEPSLVSSSGTARDLINDRIEDLKDEANKAIDELSPILTEYTSRFDGDDYKFKPITFLNSEGKEYDISDIDPPALPEDLLEFNIDDIIKDLEGEEFTLEEEEYVDTLTDRIVKELKAIYETKGMPLGEDEEKALWEKTVTNIDKEYEKQERIASAELSSHGWDIPTGSYISGMQEVRNARQEALKSAAYDYTVAMITLSRNIYIESLKIGVSVEQMLRDFFNQVQSFRVQFLTAKLQSKISLATTNTDIHKANVSIQIEKAKLAFEKYAKQVDAWATKIRESTGRMSVITDANRANLEAYFQKINTIKQLIEKLAGIYTQKVASVYAALNTNLSMGDSVNVSSSWQASVSESIGLQGSLNETHNYVHDSQ